MDERDPGHRPVPDHTVASDEVDETAAAEARERFRADGMAPLASDDDIAALLRPGERIFATHRAVNARYHSVPDAVLGAPPVAGTLHLTSARIIVAGSTVLTVDLEDVDEAVLSGGRLLLVLRRGMGLSLSVERPRLLRVQIAAVRAVARDPDARPPDQGARYASR
jgi:hypothetical protein